MSTASAYARLQKLGVPAARTAEVAAVLGQSLVTAAQTVRRLAKLGLVQPMRHGLVWLLPEPIDPWRALPYLAAPYPAYASLYSALYLRGALSQLPGSNFAVTLGRTQRIRTSVGTFSLHRVAPNVFGGFEVLPSGAHLATLEKALFDLAYLSATRSRLFAQPPELELPKRLRIAHFSLWLDAIEATRRRTQVAAQLKRLLKQDRLR
ncbi:MAG: hypothetical protein ACKVPX_09010 [Myxococcaceae bacterium]